MTCITNISSNTTFDVEIVHRAVFVTLMAHNLDDYEVSVLLTDDPRMTDLNREYRGIDAPTDVLAFPQLEGKADDLMYSTILGDVVISLETAARQAINETHSLEEEVAFLTVHGVLHLIGYDHQTKKEAAVMFAKQDTILRRMQIDIGKRAISD